MLGEGGIGRSDTVTNLVCSQIHSQVKDIISQYIITTRYVPYF